MTGAYEIRNELADTLEVWVEPWCHSYKVPPGATLKLTYVAGSDPLHTELNPELLAVWPNSDREPDAELDGRRIAPDFSVRGEAAPPLPAAGAPAAGEPAAAAPAACRASRMPPGAVWAVAAGFILLVPFYQWTEIGLRDWRHGGSPAAALEAPYFWAVTALRTGGAIALGLLLLMLRRPAVPWVAIAATWLAGPPLTFM